MEIKKINYGTAVFFGIFSFIFNLLLGVFTLTLVSIFPNLASVMGNPEPINAIISGPITFALIVYLTLILAIYVYNLVAKIYPISLETK